MYGSEARRDKAMYPGIGLDWVGLGWRLNPWFRFGMVDARMGIGHGCFGNGTQRQGKSKDPGPAAWKY